MPKQHVGGHAAEILAARLEAFEIVVLFVRTHFRKWPLCEILVDCGQRGSEQFRWRKGKLVALARRSWLPWTAAIESLARAPSAAQLLVDVIWNAGLERPGPLFILRDQARNRGLDEGGFLIVEKQIGGPARLLRNDSRSRRIGGRRRRVIMFLRRPGIDGERGRQHRGADCAGCLDQCSA